MIANLKNGDTIITTGGIVGKIHNIDNNNIIIDTSSTKITISRSYVSQLVKKDKNKDKQKIDLKLLSNEYSIFWKSFFCI